MNAAPEPWGPSRLATDALAATFDRRPHEDIDVGLRAHMRTLLLDK